MPLSYRADPPAMRLAVDAEGMTLVYHRPSGMTHILLPPAPEILAVMADGAADPATIAARLTERHGLAEDAEAIGEVVLARLVELAAAGLVTPA